MGPLAALRIVEIEGIGPGPLCGMILADLGAQVTLIGRPNAGPLKAQFGERSNLLNRGKRSIVIDLKRPEGIELALGLISKADALIEGNRPGVMERLGLGPDDCLKRNPRLAYGRITGWGQSGPLAQAAGHDLNYVALTGVLARSRRPAMQPIIPPGSVGDAPGALALAFGIVCAVLEAKTSGKGQVVDAAITDVVAMLGAIALVVMAPGPSEPNQPQIFNASPFYDVFECADGLSISVGAMEPQFYRLLLEKLGITDIDPHHQYDVTTWDEARAKVAAIFRTRPRSHWCSLMEGSDACFAPVLEIDEAARHPHNLSRGTFFESGGVLQAAAAPRFSRSTPELPTTPPSPGAHTVMLLRGLGLNDFRIAELSQLRVVFQSTT